MSINSIPPNHHYFGTFGDYTLDSRYETLREVLPQVIGGALQSIQTTGYVRRSGRTSQWALDLRVPLSEGNLLGPICRHMHPLLSERGISQIAGRGYGAFWLIGGLLALDA